MRSFLLGWASRPAATIRTKPVAVIATILTIAVAAAALALSVSTLQSGRSQVQEIPVTPSAPGLGWARNSPLLARNPLDARRIVLAHRWDAPEFGCGLWLSGDGGDTWAAANPVPILPAEAERCYAPELAFGPDGTLYYLFLGLRGAGNNPVGVFLAASEDGGRTFGSPVMILGASNYMVRMAVDPSNGPKGRIHIVWVSASGHVPVGGFPPSPNPIMAAFSDDGGRTLSAPNQVSDAWRARVVAPAIAVGSTGIVHISYYDLQDDARDYQGLEGPVWEGMWSLLSSVSMNSGRSYGPTTS